VKSQLKNLKLLLRPNPMSSKEICRPRPTPEAASELELVARAQRGEEAAFFALYELHKSRVYAICLRLSGAAEQAEDLTRNVFLRVFRNILAFRKDGDFGAALQDSAIRAAMALRRQGTSGQRLSHCQEDEAETAQTGRESSKDADDRPSDATVRSRRENRPMQRFLDFDPGPFFWN
jgi:RNA polymerase sigma-70 factor (ECF subfamily)